MSDCRKSGVYFKMSGFCTCLNATLKTAGRGKRRLVGGIKYVRHTCVCVCVWGGINSLELFPIASSESRESKKRTPAFYLLISTLFLSDSFSRPSSCRYRPSFFHSEGVSRFSSFCVRFEAFFQPFRYVNMAVVGIRAALCHRGGIKFLCVSCQCLYVCRAGSCEGAGKRSLEKKGSLLVLHPSAPPSPSSTCEVTLCHRTSRTACRGSREP